MHIGILTYIAKIKGEHMGKLVKGIASACAAIVVLNGCGAGTEVEDNGNSYNYTAPNDRALASTVEGEAVVPRGNIMVHDNENISKSLYLAIIRGKTDSEVYEYDGNYYFYVNSINGDTNFIYGIRKARSCIKSINTKYGNECAYVLSTDTDKVFKEDTLKLNNTTGVKGTRLVLPAETGYLPEKAKDIIAEYQGHGHLKILSFNAPDGGTDVSIEVMDANTGECPYPYSSKKGIAGLCMYHQVLHFDANDKLVKRVPYTRYLRRIN